MKHDLQSLLLAYPLPTAWPVPEMIEATVQLGDLPLQVAGLMSQRPEGPAVTGSAADVDRSPLFRAYMELIERIAIVEAEENLLHRALFPTSPEPDRWRFAKSNGVAARETLSDAEQAAGLELIERDRVLRNWFGESAPQRVFADVTAAPNDYYDTQLYRMAETTPAVVVCVAFPKVPGAPLSLGFAARFSVEEAMRAAAAECRQRIGFLWGELLPKSTPKPSPTPDFHQEFFLSQEGERRLRLWLAGCHALQHLDTPPPRWEDLSFVDITPQFLVGRLAVVKAQCAAAMPLMFGEAPLPVGIDGELQFHPIA